MLSSTRTECSSQFRQSGRDLPSDHRPRNRDGDRRHKPSNGTNRRLVKKTGLRWTTACNLLDWPSLLPVLNHSCMCRHTTVHPGLLVSKHSQRMSLRFYRQSSWFMMPDEGTRNATRCYFDRGSFASRLSQGSSATEFSLVAIRARPARTYKKLLQALCLRLVLLPRRSIDSTGDIRGPRGLRKCEWSYDLPPSTKLRPS